jgi:hypothetical protein
METKDIISFIKYGVDKQQTQVQQIFGCWGIIAMALLSGIFGFSYSKIWISSITYFLSLVFFIVTLRLSKRTTLKDRVASAVVITT